jgi:hypothetical protein
MSCPSLRAAGPASGWPANAGSSPWSFSDARCCSLKDRYCVHAAVIYTGSKGVRYRAQRVHDCRWVDT